MRIGIVSYWFNRGQATVGRYIRGIFEGLGHETFVLARPTMESFELPFYIERDGVWAQERVTEASSFEIPMREYETWAYGNRLDAVFFDQNYQFNEIRKLRKKGIKTIGRFVWESFGPKHVKDALKAFDVIYSLTECERVRYQAMGIESPKVRWGCHPELLSVRPERPDGLVKFFYPGGYLSKRKPTKAVFEAFSSIKNDNIRLVLKAQSTRYQQELIDGIKGADHRIEIVSEDQPMDDYYRLFSSCHVCLAPSRWEGLGLHLYEALAFKMPIITNNVPPMNELVMDGLNGLLVESIKTGLTPSGIPAYDPESESLRHAIELLSSSENLKRMTGASETVRNSFSWDKTVKDFNNIIVLK